MTDIVVHKTWLLDGFFHSAPGFITLDGNTFSFSLVDTGTFSSKRLHKFEKFKSLSDTFEKLRKEEVIEVVNVDLNDISIKFPWYNFMGGAVLTFNGFEQSMQFSFMQPQNTKFPYHRIDNSLVQMMAIEDGVDDLKAGRAFGKKLQEILS
jgi:O-acetylhomoserine/O-acetylserine sulfhydrylase-like pyridoxal-dependent enzyme